MCIFCKLANKEIPTNIVYEDDNVTAFLDANPTSLGHTLIVPKKHYQNILECDENTNASIGKAIQKIGNALLKTYGVGINVLSNINEEAGQSVMHAHVHLIPVNKDGKKADIKFNEIGEFDANSVKDNIIKNL